MTNGGEWGRYPEDTQEELKTEKTTLISDCSIDGIQFLLVTNQIGTDGAIIQAFDSRRDIFQHDISRWILGEKAKLAQGSSSFLFYISLQQPNQHDKRAQSNALVRVFASMRLLSFRYKHPSHNMNSLCMVFILRRYLLCFREKSTHPLSTHTQTQIKAPQLYLSINNIGRGLHTHFLPRCIHQSLFPLLLYITFFTTPLHYDRRILPVARSERDKIRSLSTKIL